MHHADTLFFDQALVATGWQRNVRIEIADGRILAVSPGSSPRPGEDSHAVGIAGVANVHSHGFQRGMAGLTEVAGPASDNFWTWREAMYRFLATMTPEDVEAITALAFAEMVESGFTSVGEFHYLHNDIDGRPYGDCAELSRRIVAAAQSAGIALTLLPVFYAHATFGGALPNDGQRRFITDLDSFARLLDESRAAVKDIPDGQVGVAPHSLRAVTPDELVELRRLAPSAPFHMHVAEQTKEVRDCVAWSGRRPVEWLLEKALPDRHWCLIHLTHMTEEETAGLAQTGAIAGLCPVTEANLGDGIFNGPGWTAGGGRYAVGTDSNILIDLTAELRQLEYAQRLGRQARNVMAGATDHSTGRALYDAALSGGAAALGRGDFGLVAGAGADIVELAPTDPAAADRVDDQIIDSWIFAGGFRVATVWRAGAAVVREGRHVRRQEIVREFGRAMRRVFGT
jgi:formiminoglutamate deiminase